MAQALRLAHQIRLQLRMALTALAAARGSPFPVTGGSELRHRHRLVPTGALTRACDLLPLAESSPRPRTGHSAPTGRPQRNCTRTVTFTVSENRVQLSPRGRSRCYSLSGRDRSRLRPAGREVHPRGQASDP